MKDINNVPIAPTGPAPVRLMIVMQDGRIGISGPIDNPLLCYGLLESAKDAIRAHISKKQETGLSIASFLPPGLQS